MTKEKYVDESWKESAKSETSATPTSSPTEKEHGEDHACGCGHSHDEGHEHHEHEPFQINFTTYLSSLGFQAMIYLGQMPHPVTNKIEKNFEQSKYIIDTLIMLRDKTKGNLSKDEEDLLNGSLYELQLKYVEVMQKESKAGI